MNKKDLKCPSCGSEPIKNLMRLDGVTVMCSNTHCNKTFHRCRKTNSISHETPLNCCQSNRSGIQELGDE